MSKRGRPKSPDILTPREQEVLALLRENRSNEEIAERLGISVSGVKYHVSEILGKLHLENRTDAARWQPEARPWWAGVAAPIAFLWRKAGVASAKASSAALVLSAAIVVVVLGGLGLIAFLLIRDGEGEPGGPSASEVPRILDSVLLLSSSDDQWPENLRVEDVSLESEQILVLVAPIGSACGKLVVVSLRGETAVLAEDVQSFHQWAGSATFSPSGDRVAYVPRDCTGRGGGLKVVDLDGGQAITIVDNAYKIAAWTPGNAIMFHKVSDGDYELWEVGPDGTDLREVTSRPLLGVSRDGTTFASNSAETGLVLVSSVGEEFQALDTYDFVEPGHFSSDGRRYAFNHVVEGGYVELALADLEDRSRRTLLSGEEARRFGWIKPVAWSPDGEVLLVQLGKEALVYAILVDAPMPDPVLLSSDDLGLHFLWRGPLLIHGGGDEVWASVLDVSDAGDGEIEALRDGLRAAFPEPIVPGFSPVPGDVNCDGTVDSVDSTLVLQLGAGPGVQGWPVCWENADVSGDGDVNSIDSAIMLQLAAGVVSTLPPP